jgi:4-diphosphocytidyl-2-C-methyl-D-erythritol kinase
VDIETAYAKINLALHVRARQPNGYHLLETLFVFAKDGDQLSVRSSDGLTLAITGAFAHGLSAGEDNLVLRAARILQERFGVTEGAALHLDKRLPVAAGIGGGSADAAAALRLLARHWALDCPQSDLLGIASGLGADVPACILSHPVRGEGVGDHLLPVDSGHLRDLPLLLVNPLIACPTGPVFAGWDGFDRGALGTGDPLIAAHAGRNDLESAAERVVPAITPLLAALARQPGVILSRMSGSGATCFALFDSEQARDDAALHFPGYWCLATRLRG